MRTISPKLDARQITIAEDQHEYKPVTAALVTHSDFPAPRGFNTVLMTFSPNDEERKRIAAGEDLYISLLTFGGPMQPIIVQVGAQEAAWCYNVPVAV